VPFECREADRRFYNEHLASWLPSRILDEHTHVWLKELVDLAVSEERVAKWPRRVADQNPIEDLLASYELMFPKQKVTPLVFGYPATNVDLDRMNGYVSQVSRQHNLPCLLISTPAWSADEVERRVQEGGFLGLKPYLSFAPPHIAAEDVTIFDFLPREHLEVANAHRWVVLLHIPRPGRLKDPVNLEQMLEIERRYPDAGIIIAHIGRAYCVENVGTAFEVLEPTENLVFDFSGSTNGEVMAGILRTAGPKRVLFGSDLPIVRMRMRRICDNGSYVNLVPPGLYGDISDDPHMREVTAEEGEQLSFFMYEELLAFRRAAEATGLSSADLQDVFYNNAARLISAAGGSALV
jgi:predicted TIM-barrel fold metal-dependent hydrolase